MDLPNSTSSPTSLSYNGPSPPYGSSSYASSGAAPGNSSMSHALAGREASPLFTLPSTAVGAALHNTQTSVGLVMDTTGQIAPAGVKPRVTATLWEDEGSLCFQVEAKGVRVARREDNHMINGTKLLNVADMSRGRRDGILKSEKVRHIVKIGPMHLKGVWLVRIHTRVISFPR
jgi:enhanced filamentous growth protein 1